MEADNKARSGGANACCTCRSLFRGDHGIYSGLRRRGSRVGRGAVGCALSQRWCGERSPGSHFDLQAPRKGLPCVPGAHTGSLCNVPGSGRDPIPNRLRAHRWSDPLSFPYAPPPTPNRPLSFALPIIQVIRGTILLRWTTPPAPTSQQQNRKRKNNGRKREKGIGICKEVAVFIRYYASTQSRARTPEERSVVTCTTAPSSPERSRHRRTRSSPKFSLRWLAA